MNFKERWELCDETCEKCGAITRRQRGLTKQSLKRLITPQWNINEVVITSMIIMVIVLAFAYNKETKECKEWIKEMYGGSKEICQMNCNSNCQRIERTNEINVTNLTIAMNEFNANP